MQMTYRTRWYSELCHRSDAEGADRRYEMKKREKILERLIRTRTMSDAVCSTASG